MFLCNAGPSVPPEPEGTSAEAQAEEPRRETEVIERLIFSQFVLNARVYRKSSELYDALSWKWFVDSLAVFLSS